VGGGGGGGGGGGEREKAKVKMHKTHKVQCIVQGSFPELNMATFYLI